MPAFKLGIPYINNQLVVNNNLNAPSGPDILLYPSNVLPLAGVLCKPTTTQGRMYGEDLWQRLETRRFCLDGDPANSNYVAPEEGLDCPWVLMGKSLKKKTVERRNKR